MSVIANPADMTTATPSLAVHDPAASTKLTPSSTGGQGSKVVVTAATPLQLSVGGVSTPCTAVVITARIGNTKEVAFGFSNTVRATAGAEVGACLQPGDSVTLQVSDLSLVWIDAQVNGEGVSYTYTTN